VKPWFLLSWDENCLFLRMIIGGYLDANWMAELLWLVLRVKIDLGLLDIYLMTICFTIVEVEIQGVIFWTFVK
jgi:hypothetical protein